MKRARVNEIDLLRFVAAMAVVLFHYTFRGYAADGRSVMPYPWLVPISKYGYLGVDLFFMISGFVILMTAESGSFRRFMVSRITRLYPAFWACCTLTFAICLTLGGPHYAVSIHQYLINMTMLSGFVGVESIDGVYWSLFVEMHFYALIAALLLIGRIEQAQAFLITWLAVTLALIFVPVPKLNHILLVDYSPFFAAGAAYYLAWSQGMSRAKLSVILFAWCLAEYQTIHGIALFKDHYHADINRYVIAGIITVFFVVMFLVSTKRTGFWGRKRWLLAGVVTYPLYLLHQNIGYIIFNHEYPAINPHILLWSTVAAALAMAVAVHRLVEKPLAPVLRAVVESLLDRALRLTARSFPPADAR